jgi:hypothetical protein
MPDEIEVQQRQRRFEDYMAFANQAPHPQIVRLINENAFPFGRNTFFSYDAPKLSANEFNRCAELFIERGENGTAMTAMQLMGEITRMEEPHKEALQNLAISVVKEMYNVPDSLDLKAMLEMPNMEEDCAECEPPEENMISDERKEQLQQHIEKRRILNDIVHGAAVHQWTSAYYIANERLLEMNEELCPKYNKLSALVNYWNWKFYYGDAVPPVLQGVNKCSVKNKTIEAKAMNFPVLIHELSKGVLDYLVSVGIPDLPPHELKYIYSEADKYSHEQWHYFFGPTLWRAMLDTADVRSQELPPILSAMAKMDYVDLSNFCIDITFHPEETGKKQMEVLKKSSE